MTTVADYLLTIAAVLGDDEPMHEYTRYTRKMLLDSINAAVQAAAVPRSDLFTEHKIVKLNPGTYQDIRGCFDNVFDVQAQVDESGNILRKLDGSRALMTTVKSQWSKASALADTRHTGFLLASVTLDATFNGRFQVTPAIPVEKDVYVLVKGFKYPRPLTEADLTSELTLPPAVMNAAYYFVLSRMKLVDRNTQESQAHMQTFLTLLNLTDISERAAESVLAAPDGSVPTTGGVKQS